MTDEELSACAAKLQQETDAMQTQLEELRASTQGVDPKAIETMDKTIERAKVCRDRSARQLPCWPLALLPFPSASV